MKQLIISVHSVVDVITNSSTVIYTQASSGAVEIAKAIINDILQTAGSDKAADDLFNIEVAPMFDDFDQLLDTDDEDIIDKLPKLPSYSAEKGWEKYNSECNKYWTDNYNAIATVAKEIGAEGGGEYGNNISNKLIITSKDGKSAKLAEMALSLFSQEAERDG